MCQRIELPKSGEIDRDTKLAAASLFQQQGVLSIGNAFTRNFVAKIAKAFSQRYASLSPSELARRHALVGDNRYMISIEISPPFNSPKLFANNAILSVLHELLGPDCIVSSFGSVLALPGADAQGVHFDYPPLFESEELCVSLPPYAITLVVPLIDLDDMTGSTAVWEGVASPAGRTRRIAWTS